MASESCQALVNQFLELQQNRAIAYSTLESAHKTYLQTAPDYDFQTYRQHVAKITEQFASISKQILAIIAKLEINEKTKAVAELMKDIQAGEKDKLQLTTKLQCAKQDVIDHPDQDYELQVRELRKEQGQIIIRINEILRNIRYEIDS
ncbi:Uncharacterized protein C19orf60-like protein [Trichoplax sp. H2]|nr:Uncharacterized protein C19orf60-like protein [Trichoplax sp. H2]|eukprot:RDD42219.1 Uncharacterized protein C19orf60-like protein [Trichoplax sp. H2]